jgi:hypothetical protein
VTIGENGQVISATAVSGPPSLQAAAVSAARGARFSPTKLSGVPVKVAGTIIYNFDRRGVSSTSTSVPATAPVTPRSTTERVMVAANAMWVDTGISLSEGTFISINGAGEWSDGGVPRRFWGPNGTGQKWPNTIVEDANLDALVGRIGNQTFVVGTDFSGPSPSTGRLYLSINDVPGSFGGNEGSMSVVIVYTPK